MSPTGTPGGMRRLSRRGFIALSAGVAGTAVAGCEAARADRVTAGPAAGAARPRVTTARPRDPLAAERARAGTPDWQVRQLGSEHEVEGFAVPAGGPPGTRVHLYLSTTRRRARVEAFRMGWYGGAGARRVWSSPELRLPDQNRRIRTVEATRTVSGNWEPGTAVDTSGWPEGAYLFRLTSEGGAQRFLPYVVTSPTAAGRLLLVHATATWQAYGDWGGYSLYHGPGGPADYDNRAYTVSMDRPLPHNGAATFLAFERPVVELVERLGLPVAHTTSAGLHGDGRLARDAVAVVSLGHDEYWSPEVRQHVTAARDHGVNVLFLGANACFRRIRFSDSPLGAHRQVTCYKTDYMQDPLYGKDNRAVTNDWREPPAADPESSLTGTFYEGFPAAGSWTVADPNFWALRGLRVRTGEEFPGIVGPEYDRVNPGFPTPRPITVFGHSKVICKGVRSFSDSAYYTHRSGAGVLNVGTMHWTAALDRTDHKIPPRSRRFATAVTANILRQFARGPLAERLPARDNLHRIKEYAGDPIGAGHNLW
jgi:hypothetical protein